MNADVVIGAVLSPSARAPILITRKMLKLMKSGSVIVDVAIDQGGMCETSRPTTLEFPIYIEEGVIHYCVTNMPGAVPRTSTYGITNVTLPYTLKIANQGFIQAIKTDFSIANGVNTYKGFVTNNEVALAHKIDYKSLNLII